MFAMLIIIFKKRLLNYITVKINFKRCLIYLKLREFFFLIKFNKQINLPFKPLYHKKVFWFKIITKM